MPRFGAALRHNRIFFKTSRPRICYSPKARIHIILIDGTLSRLTPGHETNVGLMYKMLRNDRALRERVNIYYQPGLQWRDWANVHHLAIGRGINAHIKGAYGWLAMRYRTGDQIYLVGFSRGACAVRSLSGWIASLGSTIDFTTPTWPVVLRARCTSSPEMSGAMPIDLSCGKVIRHLRPKCAKFGCVARMAI